jgi:hypothetical protein
MEIKQKDLITIKTIKRNHLDQVTIWRNTDSGVTMQWELPEDIEVLGWFNEPSFKMILFRYKGDLFKRFASDNVDYGEQLFLE